MPPPNIPILPDWPNRNERPETFNAKVNAFLPAMNPWGAAVNAVAGWVQSAWEDIATKAGSVAQAAGDMVTLRNQAQQFALTAVNAPGTMATSTSTMTIGTGAKALRIQAGKSIIPGHNLVVSVDGDGAKRMFGRLDTYDPTTGDVTFTCDQAFGAAGPYSAWRVALSPPGSIPIASLADWWEGLDNSKALTAALAAALQLYRPLTDAASIVWDVKVHGYFTSVVLGGNRLMPTPLNLKIGDYVECMVIQPNSGGPRSLSLSTDFKTGRAGAPVWSTSAGAIDIVRGKVLTLGPTVIDTAQKQVF